MQRREAHLGRKAAHPRDYWPAKLGIREGCRLRLTVALEGIGTFNAKRLFSNVATPMLRKEGGP